MTDKELYQQMLHFIECSGYRAEAIKKELKARLAQPEPVRVSPKEFIAAVTGKWDITGIPMVMSVWPTPEETVNGWPLYSGIPKKEWVGLTHEEIMNLVHDVRGQNMVVTTDYLARAIEAKLKEKNSG